ncbi:hypothetical protein [Tabrizicola sp.]|uniref:hypothetical protein n=1 Tax=Tabrizicola sp. TaxID=2005166 RepID=UPI00273420D4|nr:hypothetical protein [Tabrizicola sp.]MDP3195191.1 hypothetical protein [Tabrizicola sp.]MDZ4067096.1 hypothetical protein [Tabrizicola sp.]
MKLPLLVCAFVTVAFSANAETSAVPDCDYVEIRNLTVYRIAIPGCSVEVQKPERRDTATKPLATPKPQPILVADPDLPPPLGPTPEPYEEPGPGPLPEPEPQPEPTPTPQPEQPLDDGNNGHGNDPGRYDPSNPADTAGPNTAPGSSPGGSPNGTPGGPNGAPGGTNGTPGGPNGTPGGPNGTPGGSNPAGNPRGGPSN